MTALALALVLLQRAEPPLPPVPTTIPDRTTEWEVASDEYPCPRCSPPQSWSEPIRRRTRILVLAYLHRGGIGPQKGGPLGTHYHDVEVSGFLLRCAACRHTWTRMTGPRCEVAECETRR